MRKLLVSVICLAVIVVVVLGAALYWITRPLPIREDTFVEIAKGTSTRAIANKLAEQGLVRSPYAFLAVRLLQPGSKLQAGEYEFSGEINAWQVLEKIKLGQIFYEEVTVPEGSNRFDIAAILERTDTITGDDFLLASKNPSMIRDLDAQAPSLEGYLFPSTYRVTHKTSAKELCRQMTDEFRRQWKAMGGTPADAHRAVTLASLVEKESAIPMERPMVAAVFDDRLKMKMPLQCDPTTVYAALLEHRYRGTIYKSDLASTNAYNTYAHAGLPPGPIANPGVASLKAALNPAQTKALYFVAKGDGSGAHYFSDTLAEHQLAVERYRKAQH